MSISEHHFHPSTGYIYSISVRQPFLRRGTYFTFKKSRGSPIMLLLKTKANTSLLSNNSNFGLFDHAMSNWYPGTRHGYIYIEVTLVISYGTPSNCDLKVTLVSHGATVVERRCVYYPLIRPIYTADPIYF